MYWQAHVTKPRLCLIMENQLESTVRGYHVYCWDTTVREILPCVAESSNSSDGFAVTVMRNDVVIGHVPRNVSAACGYIF